MKSAQDRLNKWKARYSGDSKPAIVTDDYKTIMQGKMETVFNAQVAVESAVAAVLATAGTSVIQSGFYYAFGKEAAKLQSKFSGNQLLNVVDIYINKWVGRGLDRDLLEAIRNSVFDIPSPS